MQINIDNRSEKHIVGFNNYRDMNTFLQKLPTQIDEIQINGQVLSSLSLTDFPLVFSKILPLLKNQGVLHIESLDGDLLCHSVACGGMALDELNRILFNGQTQGIYNLISLEHFFVQQGLETHAKGYEGSRFYLTMHRP